MKKIYIEANDEIINEILVIARDKLGKGVNAIDLNPVLYDEEAFQ